MTIMPQSVEQADKSSHSYGAASSPLPTSYNIYSPPSHAGGLNAVEVEHM